jgi:acyl-CoA synthetase (AMP-forming)/AMP-acid ligase II
MQGLMMGSPLVTTSLLAYAATYHGDVEIVSRSVEGPIHRYTYAECYKRTQRLAGALARLGIANGDRVATMAWNTYRHLELYFGIAGYSAVCHTINPRLFHDQIEYIVNHAADRFIFLDLSFVELLEGMQDKLGCVEGFVIMTDAAHMPETTLRNALCYEDLLAAETDDFEWPDLDERAASSLCYTSGTTGNPKGALYTHRATVLHSMAACMHDHTMSLSSQDTAMPVVPMFHVHAWGLPYAAATCGAKLVLPGAKLDGESLHQMLVSEKATFTAGVPTLWFGLLDYLERSGNRLDDLERMGVGGAAVPLWLIRQFDENYDVEIVQGWGMTETGPVATCGTLKRKFQDVSPEEKYELRAKAGRIPYGVEFKIVDDDGNAQPHDGEASGEIFVRGPWIISAYFNDDEATAATFDADGWFGTGDVATIDGEGYVQITDRAKDLIKSGGEWISSIDLENAAVAHPDVAEAAAIAMAHPRWGERPLLVIVRRDDAEITADDIQTFLADKVAKWWLPDDITFVDELPHTATGKISKLTLRQQFADYNLPTAEA